MISFNRKVVLGIGTVAVVLACLSGTAAWLVSRENVEDTIVTLSVEESRRLLQHEAFRPQGPQATLRAQAAAQALVGGLFDIAGVYTADGLLMAEQMTPAGSTLEKDLVPHAPPAYRQAFYESQRLPGDRWMVRVFIPLRSADQALIGYVEGVRLVPDWQRALINSDAIKVALMVALATLLCGAALYPVVIRQLAGNQRTIHELLASHLSMMEALGRAIARRDSDSGAHNYRVAWIAATLAEAVGLHGQRMQELIAGSFLHDIGKIGIPESILLKPGRLNEDEMAVMRTHVDIGEEIVTGTGWLEGGRAVIAGHHEKWDGTGYPRGLAGEDIPLVARVFAIADVFDALCSWRPHKQPMPLKEVMQILNDGAGNYFDPHLVKVFSKSAEDIYQAVSSASETEVKVLLEVMVRKHFGL